MYTSFVDFEKVYDHIPRDKLWVVLLEYDVRGQLLAVIKLLCKQSLSLCWCQWHKNKTSNVSVGLQQGCVLPPSLLFIIYMDKKDKDSSSISDITFEECNVWRLLFADDLALLSSNKIDLQYALDWFSDACLGCWDEN